MKTPENRDVFDALLQGPGVGPPLPDTEGLMASLREFASAWQAEHGKPLHTWNDRDAAGDALDGALQLVCHLEQCALRLSETRDLEGVLAVSEMLTFALGVAGALQTVVSNQMVPLTPKAEVTP